MSTILTLTCNGDMWEIWILFAFSVTPIALSRICHVAHYLPTAHFRVAGAILRMFVMCESTAHSFINREGP